MQQRSNFIHPVISLGNWGLRLRLGLMEAPLSVWVFLPINSQLTSEEERKTETVLGIWGSQVRRDMHHFCVPLANPISWPS